MARAGVLPVSTLCVCWGQGYGWSIASEYSVCLCWGQYSVCVCVCAGARSMAGVLLASTLYVCVCVLGPGLRLEYC